jgi:hypothetical protein
MNKGPPNVNAIELRIGSRSATAIGRDSSRFTACHTLTVFHADGLELSARQRFASIHSNRATSDKIGCCAKGAWSAAKSLLTYKTRRVP